jgi:ABC-type transport system involved in multi-copper enzyme maturation permease subunit
MNPLVEVGLIASREIKKNFRSIKGIILLVISLLGAGGAALVLSYARKSSLAQGLSDPEKMKAAFEDFLSWDLWYGPGDTAKYLSDAPPMLYWIMWATVWLTPLTMAVLGFDGISGELQNRTVRYWNIRSRRWAYYTGKVLGLWAVVAIFTLMIHVSVWIVGISFGIAPSSQILKWGVRFFLVTVPISGAWCGVSTLVSSNFRVPILALLTTCGVFFGLWMLKGIGLASEQMDALRYVYPNTYDEWLLSPKPTLVLQGVAALFGVMALTTSLGSFIFEKRDV